MSLKNFSSPQAFQLEGGAILPSIEIAYHTFGKLNADKSNVIWVIHALTANSNVFDWWPGLFGENDLFNPNDYFIVCANNLGSCYGSTGPLSINPNTQQKWYSYFPQITIKDIANGLQLLKNYLNINTIHTLIGGSLGGQIAQEWVINTKNLTQHLILLATNTNHSPWGIAFNESQRLAIKADRTYYSNTDDGGQKGLAAARSVALLSYRNYNTYKISQSEATTNKTIDFLASSYQRYQGEKLVNRFNAYSYVTLANAMDSHNIGRSKESITQALKCISVNTLVIGISSDLLFPIQEQEFIAKHINNAQFIVIDSDYGHDGFLIETKKISEVVNAFLNKDKINQIKLKPALAS
jgi:homoserine O-acetyltransferase/O-succinyltransferase